MPQIYHNLPQICHKSTTNLPKLATSCHKCATTCHDLPQICQNLPHFATTCYKCATTCHMLTCHMCMFARKPQGPLGRAAIGRHGTYTSISKASSVCRREVWKLEMNQIWLCSLAYNKFVIHYAELHPPCFHKSCWHQKLKCNIMTSGVLTQRYSLAAKFFYSVQIPS